MLSPAVRVREFNITDVQPYAVRLAWDAARGEDGDMEVSVFVYFKTYTILGGPTDVILPFK